jgi:hypothetical protein
MTKTAGFGSISQRHGSEAWIRGSGSTMPWIRNTAAQCSHCLLTPELTVHCHSEYEERHAVKLAAAADTEAEAALPALQLHREELVATHAAAFQHEVVLPEVRPHLLVLLGKGEQCEISNFVKNTVVGAVWWIRNVYIPDPNFFILDPGSASKNLSILTPKKWFLSSRKYDTGCSSRIRTLIFYPFRIPDPGVKKASDPILGDPEHYYEH